MQNTSVPAPPIQEGPGAIAKDSLAAESSAFPDDATSSVPGSRSTFNNTNTSGATTLPPARDATSRLSPSQRDNTAAVSGQKYPDAVGQPDLGDSKTSDQGYVGGPTKGSTAGSATYNTSTGGGSKADPAPSYVNNIYLQDSKPKGTGIQEGGFDSGAPNASFTTDIGSENDPGREGTAHFQRQFAGDAADAGLPKTQKGLDSDTPYQNLDTDQSA